MEDSIINHFDLNAIYTVFHPTTGSHGTFIRLDHILDHKTNPNKLKRF